MVAAPFGLKLPSTVSLAVIAVILTGAVTLSLLRPPDAKKSEPEELR
jgi:hypothetical protein